MTAKAPNATVDYVDAETGAAVATHEFACWDPDSPRQRDIREQRRAKLAGLGLRSRLIRKQSFMLALAVALTSCAQIAAFEKRAEPIVAQACDAFHKAEANPFVRIALVGVGAATGTGALVAEIRAFGDRFCAEGPPVTDATLPAAQAVWLADVAAKMITAAGAR